MRADLNRSPVGPDRLGCGLIWQRLTREEARRRDHAADQVAVRCLRPGGDPQWCLIPTAENDRARGGEQDGGPEMHPSHTPAPL